MKGNVAKSPEQGKNEGRKVTLGRAGKEYVLVDEVTDAVALADKLFELAADFQFAVDVGVLRWPSDSSEVEGFLHAVLAFARKCRSFNVGTHGFPGGRDCKHAYQVKSFVRGLLLVIESYMPTCCDEMKMSTVIQFCPDQVKHCTPLLDLLGKEVRLLFQVSPSLVSCWACLAYPLGDEKIRLALDLSYDKVMQPYFQHFEESLEEKGDDRPFPPGPRRLFAEAASV